MNKTAKKFLIIFGFFIISLLFAQSKVYGTNIKLCEITDSSTDNVIDELQTTYGYTQDGIYNPLWLGLNKEDPLYITVEKVGESNNYHLKIGNESWRSGNIQFTALQSIWNCPYETEGDLEENNYKWAVKLKVEVEKSSNTFTFTITKIYDGDASADEINADYTKSKKIYASQADSIAHSFLNAVDAAADTLYSMYDGVADAFNFVKKCTKNMGGTFANLFLDGIMTIFGDGPQFLINIAQTFVNHTLKDGQLLYSVEELISDAEGKTLYGTYERDKYTKVVQYTSRDDMEEADIEIKDVDGDDVDDGNDDDGLGYKFEDNLIPITCVDFYTMAANKVSMLDVNFLTTEDTIGEDSNAWKALRNIVKAIIRVSIYVSAILLMTALILYGVRIAFNSMNPSARAKDQNGLNSFIVGVEMLVGSIIIMALGIYIYQAAWAGIDTSDADDYEFPIRVNVIITEKTWENQLTIKDQYYSFSTTLTGYLRFMAQIENPDRCAEKAQYVLVYVMVSWAQLIIFIGMFIRMIGMWGLAAVMPITAALYTFTKSKKVKEYYEHFVGGYLILGVIQLGIAMIYRLLIQAMGL